MSEKPSGSDRLKGASRVGTEAVVAGSVTALGALAGGVSGSIIGATVTPVIVHFAQRAVAEIYDCFLSSREKLRVNATALLAHEFIRTRIEHGDQVRRDQFLEPGVPYGRSDAEEVFEAVLLKAKQEPQERKIPFLAHAFANAAFSTVPAADIHVVVALAERMSYRQLMLLALAGRCDEFGFNPGLQFRRTVHTTQPGQQFILRDWEELRSPGVGVLAPPATVEGLRVNLTSVGEACYELLGLAEIPPDEITELTALFPERLF